jgi:lipoate-protein ligase A
MSVSSGRLIPLERLDGAENMAADQALLESVDTTGCAVLRFYGWQRPTLSLGYFQRWADRALHPESRALDCVRRATGGGAIVHHDELTYSLVVPNQQSAVGPRLDLYQRTHQSLVDTLAEYGVRAAPYRHLCRSDCGERADRFLCFQRRTQEDLIVGGYKVVGSAQRKSRASVLQHGSLLWRASKWAPQLPGIADLTSRTIPIEEFALGFASKLGEAISIQWKLDRFTESEQTRTAAVCRERFASERWLQRR